MAQETQASCSVEEWNSAYISSCSRMTPLFLMCVEPAGISEMHGGISAPSSFASIHRFASKRCLGIGFSSSVDREIGVFQHVAPPTRLRLEFPHEICLILRCAGKVGNPFQTKQGNRPSFQDQEERRGSDEVVPGTSVFPSREPGVSGTFGGRRNGVRDCFALQGGTGDFP